MRMSVINDHKITKIIWHALHSSRTSSLEALLWTKKITVDVKLTFPFFFAFHYKLVHGIL